VSRNKATGPPPCNHLYPAEDLYVRRTSPGRPSARSSLIKVQHQRLVRQLQRPRSVPAICSPHPPAVSSESGQETLRPQAHGNGYTAQSRHAPPLGQCSPKEACSICEPHRRYDYGNSSVDSIKASRVRPSTKALRSSHVGPDVDHKERVSSSH
jgi:hypothetical protein